MRFPAQVRWVKGDAANVKQSRHNCDDIVLWYFAETFTLLLIFGILGILLLLMLVVSLQHRYELSPSVFL